MTSFDENGKYIKTNWKNGDRITADKLNKIEESIEAVNDNDISRHVETDARLDALEAKEAKVTLNSPFVSVEDFGAIGNGIADDTNAIQKAIAYCSSKNLQLKLKGCRYRISNSLYLKSNIIIYGQQGSEIYFPPPEDKIEKAIFYSDYQELRNVEIRNIKLVSENTLKGSGFLVNDLVSYVQGISIYGGQNIRIIDVTMECMTSGAKFSKSNSGLVSKNIYINNLNVINSCTPILISHCEGMVIENSVLDASASTSNKMHCIYSQQGMKNIRINNLICKNAPGGGIHLFQEGMSNYSEENRGDRYIINNIIITNCMTGIYVWNCDNISISNLYVKDSDYAFSLTDTSNVNINNIQLESIHKAMISTGGCRNVYIGQGFMDCTDSGEPVLGNTHLNTDGLTIENLVFNNMNSSIIFANVNTYVDIIVKNCIFKIIGWEGNERISIRGENSKFLFINNTIYKKCESGIAYLYYSPTYTADVIFKDNTIYGPLTHIKPSNGNYERCAKSINNFFVDSHKFITD